MADTSKLSKLAATTDLTFKKDDQCTLDNILSQTNPTNSEIIWILKCVMSGVSVRFDDDIRETFSAMFPDINFKDFPLNRKKSMYVTNHGLAPYFQTLLTDTLGKSEIHIYSFDESLNDSTQTSEMDLYVRYWDDHDKLVKVRYYGSSFLGHCKANDLLEHFNELTKKLKSENLYQILMDDLNVNKKFYEDFSIKFGDENYRKLIDIGSCSLHIVHGVFRAGAEQSEWELKKFLKGEFSVFHNSSACQEDYESVTGSSSYPLSFCATW